MLGSVGVVLVAGIAVTAALLAGRGATPTPTQTLEPAPTATAAATGPLAPGEHKWDALFGGECLDPYNDAWAETFTVVDCATPHAAQLVTTGKLDGAAGAAYPGEAALTTQVNAACRAEGVFDRAALTGVDDLQVAAAFPLESQWNDGDRRYFCFANRSGGGTFDKSITPAPAPAPAPAPTATP
ncbi:MAG TPA: septum formation family protein [Candidatus Lumbricidophila sp.]|nr:septum formation family protein [Candidatus Lumbricidophila sp.]